MRTLLIVPVLLAAILPLHPPAAQPSMNGTWLATKEAPSGIGTAPSAVFGERFGLELSADVATLTRPVRGNAASLVTRHPLSGAETPVVQTGRPCFGDAIQTVTATRTAAGFDYAIVANTAPGAATTKLAITYKFRMDGDALVVESTMRDASGPKQVGTVYRRTTEALPPPLKGPNVTVARATIADLAWLSGEWAGTVAGNQVEERWLSAAGGAMLGNSRTTRGPSMVEFEFLCVAQRHGGLVYTAMPNGGGMTDFLLTQISTDGATFENPDHDFPKKIVYAKTADGYAVTISGAPGQRALTYAFTRK